MKYTLLISLFSSYAYSMETIDQAGAIYCNDAFTTKENILQKSATGQISKCRYIQITKSQNKKFSLYKSLCTTHKEHQNLYFLALIDSYGHISAEIDSWRDNYDWKNYTAVNDSGTYVVTKRDKDFWLRKITYDTHGAIDHIHTIVPIEKILFPCFFLNNNVVIAYGSETSKEKNQQILYAWDVTESFCTQQCLSRKIIYNPGKIYPKVSYRIWDEDKLLGADYHQQTSDIVVSLWDVHAQTNLEMARFAISSVESDAIPILGIAPHKKRYFACAIANLLYVRDITMSKTYLKKSSASIIDFDFQKDANNKDIQGHTYLRYHIKGDAITRDQNQRIWQFKKSGPQVTH